VDGLAIANFVLSVVQVVEVLWMLYSSGLMLITSLTSYWTFFDISYIIMNTLVSLSVVLPSFIPIESLRILEAILSIVIVLKMLYFMQLIDQIAPLVYVIFRIFYDIAWFMVVFIMILFANSTAFYLVGQNQKY
jgi:hypothetical protein